MNKVKTLITSGLIVLLICLTASIHTSIKLHKNLGTDLAKIDASVQTVQTILFHAASKAWAIKILLNVNNDKLVKFSDDVERLSKLSYWTNNIIKNTLVQRDFRQTIDNSFIVMSDLKTAAKGPLNKMSSDDQRLLTSNVKDLELLNNNLQEVRNFTYDLIKDYNKKFNSIPVIFLASILGYHKLPVYII